MEVREKIEQCTQHCMRIRECERGSNVEAGGAMMRQASGRRGGRRARGLLGLLFVFFSFYPLSPTLRLLRSGVLISALRRLVLLLECRLLVRHLLFGVGGEVVQEQRECHGCQRQRGHGFSVCGALEESQMDLVAVVCDALHVHILADRRRIVVAAHREATEEDGERGDSRRGERAEDATRVRRERGKLAQRGEHTAAMHER